MANLQLFNILPIAQNMVIDAMQDAMMILDTKGRLIECNLPAKQLFEGEDPRPNRVPIAKLNPHLSLQFSHPSDMHEAELVLPRTGEVRTFSIYRSPVTDRRNRTRGNLYLLHDLTEIHTYVKELEHLASSDGLTELLNHRHFMTLTAKEAEKLQAIGSGTFSLVMFDLDHFKAINDSYGHNAGDDVLQQIGRMVSQHARTNDLCARYGGEEFVILLENTAMDQALKFAERLRSAIENTIFTSHGTGLYLTASFGVSTYTPECGNSWEFTLNQADTALYAAKAAGRNVVKPFLPNGQTTNEVARPLPY
jgi:diguanylate cyclase (GGDEF)-like protein